MATNITHIKKITVGTPVRKVTGAAAQEVGDLTNINVDSVNDGNLLVYRASTGKWTSLHLVDGIIISGGGEAAIDSPGGDF